MDTNELNEPDGGGLFLTRDEVLNIAEAFGLVVMWDKDDLPSLHWMEHNGHFKATGRFGHKFGHWVGPRHWQRYQVELRLALGLPERIIRRPFTLHRTTWPTPTDRRWIARPASTPGVAFEI